MSVVLGLETGVRRWIRQLSAARSTARGRTDESPAAVLWPDRCQVGVFVAVYGEENSVGLDRQEKQDRNVVLFSLVRNSCDLFSEAFLCVVFPFIIL